MSLLNSIIKIAAQSGIGVALIGVGVLVSAPISVPVVFIGGDGFIHLGISGKS